MTVDDDAAGQTIKNDADVRDGENESTTNTVTTSIPVKEVTDDSGADIDGEGVQVGDVLTYNVSFTIGEDGKPVTAAVVKDTVPAGTEYVAGSAKGDWATAIDDSGDTITWSFEGTEDAPLAAGTYTATFQVKVTEDALALASKSIDNTAIINVNDDPEVETNTVTNTPETGSLTISKKVTVPEGFEIDGDAEFEFTVGLKDQNGTELAREYSCSGDYTGTIASGGTVKLKHGQSITGQSFTISGLPAGATYSVEEASVDGYTVSGDNPVTGTIVKATTVEAAFENAYSVEPVTASFPVKKNLVVPEGFDGPETWSFDIVVEAVDGAPEAADSMEGTVTNEATTTSFGPFEFTKPDKYEYKVKETVPDGAEQQDDGT